MVIPPRREGLHRAAGPAADDAGRGALRRRSRAPRSAVATRFPLPGGGRRAWSSTASCSRWRRSTPASPSKHGVGAGMDWTVLVYFGLSFLAHAGFIAAMAFFVPPLGLTDDEGIDKDQLYLIQQYLKSGGRARDGGEGDRAGRRGQRGQQGRRYRHSSQGRRRLDGQPAHRRRPTSATRVQGPKDNPDPHIARAAALREAHGVRHDRPAQHRRRRRSERADGAVGS